MSEPVWYYLEAGKQAGPVDDETIAGMIRSGRLPIGALVWKGGMSGWQAWQTLPELASAAPEAAASYGGPPASAQQPQAPAYGQPAYGQPAYGQPAHAQPASAQPAYGQPAYGQPGYGQPAYGQPAYAQPGYAQPGQYPAAYGDALYPKAPLGARFVASLVDGCIFMIPAFVLIVIAVVVGQNDNEAAAAVCGVLGGILMIIAIVYGFIKDGRANGQSIGKKMMNLMVVHLPTNQPCTKGQSAGREAIRMLLGFIPYVGWLIEPIVVLAASDGRRLGDKAANTQVIAVEAYRGGHDFAAFS